ncbi:MAG: dTDP-4-dehydrorhamnose reductase [Acidobacteriota bacterium]
MSIKFLITGSDGLLGKDVSKIVSYEYPDSTIESTMEFLDIRDYDRLAMEFERILPTVVINCAAMSNVDWCEDHPDEAFEVNAEGAFNIARGCRHIGARLIHVSTDYVFDGKKTTPYAEHDQPNPLSIYGRSKWEGEKAILEENPDSIILRTSTLFGRGGPNFGSSVVDRCRKGEKIKAVVDWYSSPTSTIDLAKAMKRLLGIEFKGILHFVNSEVCSRYELASAALRMEGIDESHLIPVRLKDLDLKAPRPSYSALDNSLYTRLSGEKPRGWKEALRDFLLGQV